MVEQRSPESLSALLDHFEETTAGQEKISLGDLLETLSSRAHGPMLLAPAMLAVSPVGAIPGVPSIIGLLILLVSIQLILFSGRPWIPQRLSDFEFSRDKLTWTSDRIGPWIRWSEKGIRNRLEFLTEGVFLYPVAACCALLAITFAPLELVPFAVFVPGIAICVFALGLTARDGVLVLCGYAMSAGAVAIIWKFLPL